MTAPTSMGLGAPRVPDDPIDVEQITDRDELHEFLESNKLENAYLLGDLHPDYFPFCEWYGARRGENLEALLVHYEGLSLPAVRAVGSSRGLDSVFLQGHDFLPDRFHFHIMDRNVGLVGSQFELSNLQKMQRMGLHRDDYRSRGDDPRVRRLGHRDTAAIMALYEHYPDNLFEPVQLETGLYFGVDGPNGRLMSIAGIHVVSQTYDVAAIGNLVTHPDARGEGLATACTGRLLDELFERVPLVALNVREDNDPAISVYDSFGFQLETCFWEGRGAVPGLDE